MRGQCSAGCITCTSEQPNDDGILPPFRASSGWVPMLPQTREALEEHRRWCDANGYPTGPDDWVFGHRSHARAPIRPPIHQTTWQHIKYACARAEMSKDIAAHSLRRGFSDAARQAGVSVTDLAEMLRNDPAVALRYQSKDPELLRRQARKISRVMRPPRPAEKVTVTGTVRVSADHETGELRS